MIDDAVSRLIADIYTGAHDAAVWDAAMRRMLDLTDGRFILVSCVDLRERAYDATHFYGPDDGRFLDAVADYRIEQYRHDPTLRFGIAHPAAGFTTLRGRIAADRGYPGDLAFVRWYESEMAAADMHIHYTPADDELVMGVSLHARAAAGALTTDARQLLALAFAHIDNARRLVARAPDFTSDRDARLLIDASGRVRLSSPAADALLGTGDGLTLRGGRLSGADRRADATLARAVATAVAGAVAGVCRIERPSGRAALIVRAVPLPVAYGPFAAFGPAALLTLIDPAAGPAPAAAEQWRALFGFTPAEARLAAALLADDGNLRTVADRLGIAYATARVQLAGLFDKAQVKSQAQLARLLTRIGAWLLALWPTLDYAGDVFA